jgi:TetR/AcrR family transcriptional regulator, transcriptional repressor for nem operon
MDDTKTKILDAAQALVQSIGANAMSYQDISAMVGIRKASIHHHFPTKEALLEALIERYNRCFFGVLDEIQGSRKNGASKLREYMTLFEATLTESQQQKACPMGMLGAEVRTLGEAAAAGVERFFRENDKRLAVILEEGRKDGSLHFDGEAKSMASMIVGLAEGATLVARGRDDAKYFRTVSGQLMKLLGA